MQDQNQKLSAQNIIKYWTQIVIVNSSKPVIWRDFEGTWDCNNGSVTWRKLTCTFMEITGPCRQKVSIIKRMGHSIVLSPATIFTLPSIKSLGSIHKYYISTFRQWLAQPWLPHKQCLQLCSKLWLKHTLFSIEPSELILVAVSYLTVLLLRWIWIGSSAQAYSEGQQEGSLCISTTCIQASGWAWKVICLLVNSRIPNAASKMLRSASLMLLYSSCIYFIYCSDQWIVMLKLLIGSFSVFMTSFISAKWILKRDKEISTTDMS